MFARFFACNHLKIIMLMKKENKEFYLVPEASIFEVGSENIICQSNPGEVPENLGSGEWI